MANQTKPNASRSKKLCSGILDLIALQLAALAVKIYEGALVFRADGTGDVVPWANTAGFRLAGVSDQTVDNSASAVATQIRVRRRGVYVFAQTGTTITKAHVGARVYATDDQTVSLTANNTWVGNVENVDDEGVHVRIDNAVSPPRIRTTEKFNYSASADSFFYIAPAGKVIKAINCLPSVVGSDGGAVTAAVRKILASSSVALPGDAAGATVVELHTVAFDLKGTVGTVQAATLVADVHHLAAGDKLAINFVGTQTAAAGIISVDLEDEA